MPGYQSDHINPVQHLCTSADSNHMSRTKISMCNARLCLAKKKTEICSQKALSQKVMPRLSLRDSDHALGQLEAGQHANDIVADFRCHVCTIYHLLEHHSATGNVSDSCRSGWLRVTSVHQDQFILLTHLWNRFQSASATSRQTRCLNNRRISIDTVRRSLCNAGLRARCLFCGPRLTHQHRTETLMLVQEQRKSASKRLAWYAFQWWLMSLRWSHRWPLTCV